MSRKPDASRRAQARADRHDAHIARMSAGHRAPTDRGRQAAAVDRAHAAKLDARASRTDPKR